MERTRDGSGLEQKTIRTSADYVRQLEDQRHLLTPLLRILVQKKAVHGADGLAAISASLRKVCDTVQAQMGAFLLASPERHELKVVGVSLSSRLLQRSGSRTQADLDGLAQRLQSQPLRAKECAETQAIASGAPCCNSGVPSCFNETLVGLGYPVQSLLVVPVDGGGAASVPASAVGCATFLNRYVNDRQFTHFSDEDLALVESFALHSGRVMARVLEPHTPLNDRELAGYIARLSKCELLTDLKPDLTLISAIGAEKLRKHLVIPLGKSGPTAIRAALVNPLDFQHIGDFEADAGLRIEERCVAAESDIRQALERAVPQSSRVSLVAERISKEYTAIVPDDSAFGNESNENSALIINLANRIIEDAFQLGASDIHVEPAETKLIIRYRIDGVCRNKLSLPYAAHRPLVTRLKIMSELDIAEHRLPQDGKITFKKFSPKYDVDLRVSVAPMAHGEAVVLRLLDKQKSMLPLDRLGFSDYNLKLYRNMLAAPYGMILHCGPTGSGKSMTLYAALNEINTPELKVLTAEDPIEYTLPGINQLQVKRDIGLTFASALRCFLRQDPDIILVGEIRDKETAEIATEAALTGHILFSTLHTNDACSTVLRLGEIGVESFLIASTLVGICAQRLVRRLCSCKQEVDVTGEQLDLLRRGAWNGQVGRIFGPAGCEKCEKSGYKGRTGVHELLHVTDELRDLINRGVNTEILKHNARRLGMRTLFEDVMEKVNAGITSLPEALTTVWPDEEPPEAVVKDHSKTLGAGGRS